MSARTTGRVVGALFLVVSLLVGNPLARPRRDIDGQVLAQLESDLADLEPDEAKAFLESLGVESPTLPRVMGRGQPAGVAW